MFCSSVHCTLLVTFNGRQISTLNYSGLSTDTIPSKNCLDKLLCMKCNRYCYLKDLSHSLSRDGRVIIMSIHQPRYSILKLCDSLTLLSKGAIIYHGITKEALPYFSTVLGTHHCNRHYVYYFIMQI